MVSGESFIDTFLSAEFWPNYIPILSIKTEAFLLMNHDRTLSDTLSKIKKKHQAKKIAQDTAFECNRWPQKGRSRE